MNYQYTLNKIINAHDPERDIHGKVNGLNVTWAEADLAHICINLMARVEKLEAQLKVQKQIATDEIMPDW